MTTITPPSPSRLPRLALSALILAGAIVFVGLVSLAPASAAGLSDPSVLTKQGGMTVTQDGAIIENLEIQGTLRIEANNVTVRNVWVYGSEFWSVYVASGSARFENVEIGHPSHKGSRGIGGNNIVGINLDIHHVEDGIKLGSNSTYSGVHVHDLDSPSSSPHSDAVQVEGGSKNSTVKNSILSSTRGGVNGNAAVIVKSDLGFPSNITFANNYMNGGNYTVYVRDGGHGMPTNISFIGNRFGPSRTYGLTSFDGPVKWENNTWAETGEVIDPSGNVIGAGSPTTTAAPAPTTTAAPAPAPTTTQAPAPTTTVAPAPTTTTVAPTTTTTVAPTTTTTEPAPSTTTTTQEAQIVAADAGNPSDPTPAESLNVMLIAVGALVAVAVGGYFTGLYFDRQT